MLNYQNKTSIKLISLVLAQVFLLTGIAYPESTTNKNTYSIYIQAKDLRVPMMGSGGKNAPLSRLEKAIEKAKELQAKMPKYTSLSGTTCLFRCPSQFAKLEEILPEVLLQKIKSGDRKLNVISLGASTGGEAVSIATTILALMERQFPEEDVKSWDIIVRGVEIRPEIVKRARENLKSGDFESGATGIFYSSIDENYLPKVILQEGEGLNVRAVSPKAVKKRLARINELNIVQFQEGSIVDPQAISQVKESDIVFFNMMQYQLTEDRGITKDAVLNLGKAIQGLKPGAYLFTTSSPEELIDKKKLGLYLSEFDMDILPTYEVVLRKREPSTKAIENNLSLASGETVSVQAFADDGPITIYLDRAGVIQDINGIANELGLKIQLAGGVARRMLLGKNPIAKGSDLDIMIQVSATNPYARKIGRVTPELTKRIDDFRKILDEKYTDLKIEIINIRDDMLTKQFASISRKRASTLDRMLVQKVGDRWIVTDETGGRDRSYIDNVRKKYLCLVPRSTGSFLNYDNVLRFVRIQAEFPELGIDKGSLEDINKFIEKGSLYENDASIFSMEELLTGFEKGDIELLMRNIAPSIKTLLKIFAYAKDPHDAIKLLESIGSKKRSLVTIFGRIVDLNKLAQIAFDTRGKPFSWSDFDPAFVEELRENEYAKQYSEKDFAEFLLDSLKDRFPEELVPGDEVRIRQFAAAEQAGWLIKSNKMSIERKMLVRYNLIESTWKYFILGGSLRDNWLSFIEGKVSEEFYEHIQANEKDIRLGINQGKYRNLLDYYFKEFRLLDSYGRKAKGSPLNLVKYLIAHKNYRGNPISIEDLRKVRINQETGWSYADSTIYLEINSLKEIGILESVDRGRYVLSEEFTMDQIAFIDKEIEKIIASNSPEGTPLGLDRYRLDDVDDKKIEAMREVVMGVIKNIEKGRMAFKEGELFYLGDKEVSLEQLMPLVDALEGSLDKINDSDLDPREIKDKALLKRGLAIDAGGYSPDHPEERDLDIVIKDDLGGAVAKIKIWPLKLRDSVSFNKKAVFMEWFGIDREWMKGKGASGQALYLALSKLLYELGYREIYGYRNQGSEGFWGRMGWEPSSAKIYIPGKAGFYIEKPDSVKGYCPAIVELYRGIIASSADKPMTSERLASNQSMPRRTFLKAAAGAVVAAAAGVAVYKSGEPSREQIEAMVSLERPIHTERYTSGLQFEQEKETFIAAKSARDNLLGKEDAEKVGGFLTPGRIKAIKFAAEKWKLEPALIAGFAYEEKVDKDSKNRVKEGIKERVSKMFGLLDIRNTAGLMNVSASFMKHKAFLDFLYENRDFIMDKLLEKEEDKNMFREFIYGNKGADSREDFEGYEFIRQITEKGGAWQAWLETMSPVLNDLAEKVEPINILLGAYAMRVKAGEIVKRNKNGGKLPNIFTMRDDSVSWLVENYMDIPVSLQERYSIFNSSYYPPYAYHYFLAVDYTGIKIARERALAKVNTYLMFAKSGMFQTNNIAGIQDNVYTGGAKLASNEGVINTGVKKPLDLFMQDNRDVFIKFEEAENIVQRLIEDGKEFAVVMFDGDSIKKRNEAFGERIVDSLLFEMVEAFYETAELLGRDPYAIDMKVFRRGGDEFGFIIQVDGLEDSDIKIILELVRISLPMKIKSKYGLFVIDTKALDRGSVISNLNELKAKGVVMEFEEVGGSINVLYASDKADSIEYIKNETWAERITKMTDKFVLTGSMGGLYVNKAVLTGIKRQNKEINLSSIFGGVNFSLLKAKEVVAKAGNSGRKKGNGVYIFRARESEEVDAREWFHNKEKTSAIFKDTETQNEIERVFSESVIQQDKRDEQVPIAYSEQALREMMMPEPSGMLISIDALWGNPKFDERAEQATRRGEIHKGRSYLKNFYKFSMLNEALPEKMYDADWVIRVFGYVIKNELERVFGKGFEVVMARAPPGQSPERFLVWIKPAKGGELAIDNLEELITKVGNRISEITILKPLIAATVVPIQDTLGHTFGTMDNLSKLYVDNTSQRLDMDVATKFKGTFLKEGKNVKVTQVGHSIVSYDGSSLQKNVMLGFIELQRIYALKDLRDAVPGQSEVYVNALRRLYADIKDIPRDSPEAKNIISDGISFDEARQEIIDAIKQKRSPGFGNMAISTQGWAHRWIRDARHEEKGIKKMAASNDYIVEELKEIGRSYNWSEDFLFALETAVRELLANTIKHGTGTPHFYYRITRDSIETITRNKLPRGKRFDIESEEDVPDSLRPENLLKDHGRGIFLIRNFISEWGGELRQEASNDDEVAIYLRFSLDKAVNKENALASNEKIASHAMSWELSSLDGAMPLQGIKGRVYAVGDSHGDLDGLRDTLAGLGIISKGADENGLEDKWIAEAGTRLIQGGDAIDRGPKSIESIKYLRYLQDRSREQGSEVIRIIGNHELTYLLRHAEGEWTGKIEILKLIGSIRGFDEKLWTDDKEVVRLIKEDIRQGRLLGVYELGGTVFSHGVIIPTFEEDLENDTGKFVSDPVIFMQTVNNMLKSAVETNNYDSVIFGLGFDFNDYSYGIAGFYFKELDERYMDVFSFPQVVFHDPEPFSKSKKIEVKKAPEKNISVVDADVGMTPHYGSGRGAVVFENGIAMAAYPAGKTKDALASNESMTHKVAYLDENTCRQLSDRIIRELGLRNTRNQLPKDAKLKYGSKEYSWEEWRGTLPAGEEIDPETGGQVPYFVRVGHLFFLDDSKYQSLSDELKKDIGANVIRIRNMHKTDLGATGPLTFTMATIVAMMESDISGKQVIDAGAGHGTLSLVAAKLGARHVILIEKDHDRIQQAAENLRINGLADGADYTAVNADLADTDNIAARVSSTDLETVIISNIGTWPELYGSITNADSMKLIARIPNVVTFIGGGYSLGAMNESVKRWKDGIIRQDRDIIAAEYNFEVNPDVAIFQAIHAGIQADTAAWIARPSDSNFSLGEYLRGAETARTCQ